jgi:nicotinic acetylcholine receptor
MLLIAENIPATSETVPLITIYLTAVMSLTSVSIVLTVLLSQIHHATAYSPEMSRSFYKVMTRKVAKYIGMTHTVSRFEKNILKLNPVKRKSSFLSKTSRLSYLEHAPTNFKQTSSVKIYPIESLSMNNSCYSKEYNLIIHELNKNGKMLKNLRSDMKKILENAVVDTKTADEWKLIGIIIDRILFWFFTILTFLPTVVLLIILPVMKNHLNQL